MQAAVQYNVRVHDNVRAHVNAAKVQVRSNCAELRLTRQRCQRHDGGYIYLRALARIDRHRAMVVICCSVVDVVLLAFPAWLVEACCEEVETSTRRKRNAVDPTAKRD